MSCFVAFRVVCTGAASSSYTVMALADCDEFKLGLDVVRRGVCAHFPQAVSGHSRVTLCVFDLRDCVCCEQRKVRLWWEVRQYYLHFPFKILYGE